jgi:hypothetical protein
MFFLMISLDKSKTFPFDIMSGTFISGKISPEKGFEVRVNWTYLFPTKALIYACQERRGP